MMLLLLTRISRKEVLLAFLAVALLVESAGAYWDISYHSLNKVDTFFQPAHALIYSGAASALVIGLVLAAFHRVKRFAILSAVILFAGFADLQWHEAFGFDGLLSPVHVVLVGATAGQAVALFHMAGTVKGKTLALSAAWLSCAFALFMFSLPASKTETFDFNPPALVTLGVGIMAFPLLSVLVMGQAKSTAGVRPVIVAAVYVGIISTATLAFNPHVSWIIPLFLLNVAGAYAIERWELARFFAGAGWLLTYAPFSAFVVGYGLYGQVAGVNQFTETAIKTQWAIPLMVASGGLVGLLALSGKFRPLHKLLVNHSTDSKQH